MLYLRIKILLLSGGAYPGLEPSSLIPVENVPYPRALSPSNITFYQVGLICWALHFAFINSLAPINDIYNHTSIHIHSTKDIWWKEEGGYFPWAREMTQKAGVYALHTRALGSIRCVVAWALLGATPLGMVQKLEEKLYSPKQWNYNDTIVLNNNKKKSAWLGLPVGSRVHALHAELAKNEIF